MESPEAWAQFFGWCTVINIALLCVVAIAVVLMRKWTSKIHAKMFGLDEADLSRAYFQYLAQYKLAIFIFNLVPYLALKLS